MHSLPGILGPQRTGIMQQRLLSNAVDVETRELRGVDGVLALEARARAGVAHGGRAEFTGTAVSWGIHLFQVPFHPVWVERRLARVEVSRLPARHVGGPRVKVLNSPGQSPAPRPDGRASLFEKKKEGGPCDHLTLS